MDCLVFLVGDGHLMRTKCKKDGRIKVESVFLDYVYREHISSDIYIYIYMNF